MATFKLHNSDITATVSASAKVSSSTNTTATITVTVTGSIPSGYHVYSTGVVANITINGKSSGNKTVFGNASGYYYGKDGSKSVTYSVTVDKGTSAKDISWSVEFKNAIDGVIIATKHTASGKVSVIAKPSYTVSYNANGGSGTPSAQTKWYGTALTLSNTRPTRTGYTFQGWALTKANADAGTWYYQPGGTCGKNENLTLYAVWKVITYTVTYNANGGTGAPSAQTKTHGVNLTLSNTRPTKTGYTFQGWGTSASTTTVSYRSGASYISNAAITLYAVWKADTYSVTYNANGGTGAPSAQTKTYGVALTLSDTKPTLANYNFLGWGTSATATTVSYTPGARYTTNAAVTLYAIWELAYIKPVISNVSVSRNEQTPTTADVAFDWKTDRAVSSIKIELEGSDGSKKSVSPSASGTSGSVNTSITGLDEELTYTVKITVTDSVGYFSVISNLSGSKFIIDILAEGKGIAFNKAAELDGVVDIGFQTRLLGGLLYVLLPAETNLNECHTPGFYVGENVSTYNYTCGDAEFPLTSGTFTLEILSMGDNGQLMQRITQCHISSPVVYERVYYKSAGWGNWYGGWIYPTIGSEFAVYASDGVTSKPGCRKDGRVVELRGIVKPIADIEYSTNMHTIMTVPDGYKPNSPVYAICQGSGNCTWLLRVGTNGTVDFSRYRNGSANTTATAGAWLPFQVTYLV